MEPISAIQDDVLRGEIEAVMAPGGFDVRRPSALVNFLTIELCFRLRALIVEHAASAARSQAALGAAAAYLTGVEPLECPQYEGNAMNTAIDRWLTDLRKAAKRARKRLAIKAGEDERSKYFGLAKLNAIVLQLGEEEDVKALRVRCYATSRETSYGQLALPLPPAPGEELLSLGALLWNSIIHASSTAIHPLLIDVCAFRFSSPLLLQISARYGIVTIDGGKISSKTAGQLTSSSDIASGKGSSRDQVWLAANRPSG